MVGCDRPWGARAFTVTWFCFVSVLRCGKHQSITEKSDPNQNGRSRFDTFMAFYVSLNIRKSKRSRKNVRLGCKRKSPGTNPINAAIPGFLKFTRWSFVSRSSVLSLFLLWACHEAAAKEDKRRSACTSVLSGGAFFFPNSRSGQASFPKDVVKLLEDELHCLVLVNHVDRHVTVVPLRTH